MFVFHPSPSPHGISGPMSFATPLFFWPKQSERCVFRALVTSIDLRKCYMLRARFGAEASAPFCSACGDIGIGQKCGTNGNNFYTSFTIHIFWGLIIVQVNVLMSILCGSKITKRSSVKTIWWFSSKFIIYHISYIYISYISHKATGWIMVTLSLANIF